MIHLSGDLLITTRTGRFGKFNVGNLVTDIGEFSVKDSIIEEYEPGKYAGIFSVSRIYPHSYFAGGRVMVEVRAQLLAINLNEVDVGEPELTASLLTSDQDPLDESAQTARPTLAPPLSAKENVDRNIPLPEDSDMPNDVDPDVVLFGECWPLGSAVKLDASVDRGTLRSQVTRLKALGYQYQPVGQVWHKK